MVSASQTALGSVEERVKLSHTPCPINLAVSVGASLALTYREHHISFQQLLLTMHFNSSYSYKFILPEV